MKTNWKLLWRKVHYWGALLCALPVLIIIITGILLLLRKDIAWVQPATMQGQGNTPTISLQQVIDTAASVPEAQIADWADIKKVDIRPSHGVIKVLAKNQWEVQIDGQSAEILQVAYKRSAWILSLHEGTFFHSKASIWLFLPAAAILLLLWLTGIYLFLIPILMRRKRRLKVK
ncbi:MULTISPECIES: PepSY domain-containing protein [unclassified Lentimonas]|uniref:PepSY domain-containing protein n=1 Tax=unclassified Lentimonas TaxID=2630993 RepID=UPI00132A2A14|nr:MULTISPECIES: PepSY domain-containing protein [unclassified Lentimonas]CAA6678157.1 Unannotated [Lentimonas sp. CC4]CAA6685954.1 Unannotated [Lentimonas sp. CC6]CAA7075957.1 Unannotated [Lentimonas sp. CC4]CAA7168616.1 Unannotated [Lentimonas sp. CC21]CAA7181006.1 Unannotated [Lentimonas sp. CC8]